VPLIYKQNLTVAGVIGNTLAVMREIVSYFFKLAKLPRLRVEISRLSTGTSIAETDYR